MKKTTKNRIALKRNLFSTQPRKSGKGSSDKKNRLIHTLQLVVKIGIWAVVIWVFFGVGRAIFAADWTVLGGIFKILAKVVGFALPVIMWLLKAGVKLIILPALVYAMIGMVTRKAWLRIILGILSVYAFGKVFIGSLAGITLSLHGLAAAPGILIGGLSVYFMLILVLPREIWPAFSIPIVTLVGLVAWIMPDLPGFFDELGVISAVMAFLSFGINNAASLLQRMVGSRMFDRLHKKLMAALSKGEWFKNRWHGMAGKMKKTATSKYRKRGFYGTPAKILRLRRIHLPD